MQMSAQEVMLDHQDGSGLSNIQMESKHAPPIEGGI